MGVSISNMFLAIIMHTAFGNPSSIPFLFFIIIIFKNLFIYFWLHWVFVTACGLSLVAASGGYASCGAPSSHCGGFSCCGARALGARVSVVVARGL